MPLDTRPTACYWCAEKPHGSRNVKSCSFLNVWLPGINKLLTKTSKIKAPSVKCVEKAGSYHCEHLKDSSLTSAEHQCSEQSSAWKSRLLPKQEVAVAAGGDPLKGVHPELVGVVVGLFRSDIWTEERRRKQRKENWQEKCCLCSTSLHSSRFWKWTEGSGSQRMTVHVQQHWSQQNQNRLRLKHSSSCTAEMLQRLQVCGS